MTSSFRVSTALASALVGLVILFFGASVSLPGTARAAEETTLHVTNTNDDGIGSLRQALASAYDGDRIVFDLSGCPCTIQLASGELVVDKEITIEGLGARRLTISGGDTTRVINVTASGDLTLTGVTLTGGLASDGGGIFNQGSLQLTDSAVTGNSANNGGGLYNTNGGTLTAERVLIANNVASAQFGGGLFNGGDSDVLLTNVTISGNQAADDGAGIYNNDGNIEGNSNSVTLTNVTITENHAASDAGGIDNFGGHNNSTGIILVNTIVAGNTAGEASPDCRNVFGHTITSLANSIIGTNEGCTIASGEGDQIGNTEQPVNPLLSSLGNFGGPTDVYALMTESPALDWGISDLCPTTDQRGLPRPVGSTCDIGAYEQPGSEADLVTAVWNVKLNGQASSIEVAPGESVELTLSYQIWESTGYCPGCISQLVPGLDNNALGDCIVDTYPGVGTMPGLGGNYSNIFTAPAEPGSYEIRIQHTWQYHCEDSVPLYDGSGAKYATLVVTGSPTDTPTATATATATATDTPIPSATATNTATASPTASATPTNTATASPTATATATQVPSGGPFIVTNTNNSGDGSLRKAINDANNHEGADEIQFAIPGAGLKTIAPASALPNITDAVTINGANKSDNQRVELNGANAGANANGLNILAPSVTVRNLVINRFGGNGMYVSGASNVTLEGNYIGVNAAGTAALPNNGNGIEIENSSAANIGGAGSAARNVISGNGQRGIFIHGQESANVVVQGNYIGVGADGTTTLGNSSHGVAFDGGASTNLVGGGEGAGNIIAFNGGDGVALLGGQNNWVTQNSIFSNSGLGIDLKDDGATPNDNGDGDTGPNGLQNTPVILSANPASGDATLKARLNSTPNVQYHLEFFSNSACSSSGSAQGQTYLGTTDVTTDATGNVYFGLSLENVPANSFVTATATDPNGNTSEFSQCVPLTSANDSWVNALALDIPCPDANNPPASTVSATQTEYIFNQDQARWFKFCVTPRSKVIITLTELPSDFDLTLFKDIDAQYQKDLNNLQNSDNPQGALTQLGAEFAPDAFSPDAFSPDAFSPEVFSPDAFSPDAFSPDAFSPDAFSPDAFSPDAFSPDAFSPDAFSPDAFSPDAFSPDAFSPDAFSPDAFSPDAFSPDAFSSAQSRSVIGVSAFPGTAGEGIVVNTWDNTGDFFVRVRGKNGAFNPNATFKVTVTELTGACASVTLPTAATTLGGASNKSTLILWDRSRIAGNNAQKDALAARLNDLAAATNGTVVNVSQDAKVAQTNAQADAKPDCPFAKNLVASAIKDVVNAYDQNKNLDYVVLVGSDDVIPFFRYPDQSLLADEANYVPPVRDATSSQASLRLSYMLTQDPYGARTQVSLGTNTFAIPEIAVGRLVETASEAKGMIDAYLAGNGTISTGNGALVTGYDFLADSADAIADELNAGLNQQATTLIAPNHIAPTDSQSWNADDLRNALLGKRHDINFLAGHFSAGSALAADFSTRMLASEIAASNIDFSNALFYSAGCHSGYSIVDAHAIANVTQQPDWAQAFARKKATLIAGTGYQYGDTDVIEYSERLYLEFTRELRRGSGPVSIGQALVRAKQNYLASTPVLKGIHQKALLETAIFGLPMLSVNMPGARLSNNNDGSVVGNTNGFGSNPGQALGLRYADITVNPNLSVKHSTLQDLTNNGSVQTTYFQGGNGVVTNPSQPVLPLENLNVSVNNTVLRGVGFRGGSYQDLANIVPLTGAPATEIRGVHVSYPTQTWFPVRMWNVNYYDALASNGGSTRLLVTPAQYLSNTGDPVHGTWRSYNSLQLRLFYSGNTQTSGGGSIPALSAAPSISNINATSANGAIHFTARVVGNPAAGIQQVWVTYTGLSGPLAGAWQSLDLVQDTTDSTLWRGTLDTATPPQDVRFIVQAVNGVGLTTLAANLGAYYTPDGFVGSSPSRATTQLALDAPASGAYGTLSNVSATLTSNGNPVANKVVWFGYGAQRAAGVTNANGVATAQLNLLVTPGAFEMQATFNGDPSYGESSVGKAFSIHKQNTHIAINAPNGAVQYSDPSNLSATVRDASDRALGQVTLAFVLNSANGGASRTEITDLVSRADLGSVPVGSGSYNVDVSFGKQVTLSDGTTLNLSDVRYNGSDASAALTVHAEDATLAYTGDTALPESGALNLSATVTQADDGTSGDITLAKVRFLIKDSANKVVADETVPVDDTGKAAKALDGVNGVGLKLTVSLVGGYFAGDDVQVNLGGGVETVELSQSVKLKTLEGNPLDALQAQFKADKRATGMRLNSTKPSTFKYVVTLNNTGNVAVPATVMLNIPAADNPALPQAFCIVGPKGVQVYSDEQLTKPIKNNVTVTPDLSGVKKDESTCTEQVTVALKVPAGGKRYIGVQLSFVGKGTAGFAKGAAKKYNEGVLLTESVTSPKLTDSLRNVTGVPIVGINLTGVGGFALERDGTPRAGWTVRVRNGKKQIGTTQTDPDGFFSVKVPAGGPYKVQLVDPSGNVVATGQVDKIAKKDFVRVKLQESK